MSENKPTPTAASPLAGARKGRGLKSFYGDVMREMKQVTWPNRKETTRLTGNVLSICALIGIGLWGLSSIFELIVTQLILGNR
jgi:preprotein translocase SecE subunit